LFFFIQGKFITFLYKTKFPTLNVKSAKQIKFNEEIQSRKLENDCQNLKRNVQSLLAELNETKHLSQEMQAALNKEMLDLKNVFSEKTNSLVMETETHKNELLDEIRLMNEELMKRSSKLSAQEQEIESIKGQIMSECIYESINFPKYHRKNLIDFSPGRFYRLLT
jgi:hypothetical protein